MNEFMDTDASERKNGMNGQTEVEGMLERTREV